MAPQPPPTPSPSAILLVAGYYNDYILPFLPGPLRSLSDNISPIIHSVLTAASNGDLISLAAFLLTVYLSLKIADYIRRTVIGWVVLIVKLAMLAGVVAGLFYVNEVGWEKAMKQAQWIANLIWGLVEDKVVEWSEGKDNGTGGYGGGGVLNGGYGGGGARRQQVPVQRGKAKANAKSGWL